MISVRWGWRPVKIGPEMVRAWVGEIEGSWGAARVRRIEGADLWVAMEVYPKGWLIFSWFPEACGCGLVTRETVDRLIGLGRSMPPISLALKSHLAGARLVAAGQINADRVFFLRFSRPVGLGISLERTVVMEASPRFANLVLADEKLRVIEAASHAGPGEEGLARTGPGWRYLPPPSIEGRLPQEWPAEISPENLKSLRGIGKNLIEGLQDCWEALENPGEALRGIYDSLSPDAFLPQRKGGALTVFPVVLPGFEALSGSALEVTGAEIAFSLAKRATFLQGRRKGDTFANQSRRLRNRLDGLRRQLADCEEAETWRKRGEALLSSDWKGEEGVDEVEATYWGADGPEVLRIPVDPELTKAGNSQACFRRYRKGKDIRERVVAEIRNTECELGDLEQDELLAEALALWGATNRRGKKPAAGKGKKDGGVHRLEIGGFPVLVGTSAKGNRNVTFRLASGEDLWFHAKDIPGAHVIVKTGKRQVPEEVIVAAAQLAAFFSKARNNPMVVVEMTEKRHVRSRQGVNPGEVSYTFPKAYTVRPSLPSAGS